MPKLFARLVAPITVAAAMLTVSAALAQQARPRPAQVPKPAPQAPGAAGVKVFGPGNYRYVNPKLRQAKLPTPTLPTGVGGGTTETKMLVFGGRPSQLHAKLDTGHPMVAGKAGLQFDNSAAVHTVVMPGIVEPLAAFNADGVLTVNLSGTHGKTYLFEATVVPPATYATDCKFTVTGPDSQQIIFPCQKAGYQHLIFAFKAGAADGWFHFSIKASGTGFFLPWLFAAIEIDSGD